MFNKARHQRSIAHSFIALKAECVASVWLSTQVGAERWYETRCDDSHTHTHCVTGSERLLESAI